MAHYSSVFILGVIAAALGLVSGISETEKNNIRAAALPLLSDCERELDISRDTVIQAIKSKNPDALNPCFYACFFKKIGTINEQGLYDPAVSKQLHQKYVQNDVAKLDAVLDVCVKVNTQPVRDGPKGCDRANMLVHCLIENRGDLSLIGA